MKDVLAIILGVILIAAIAVAGVWFVWFQIANTPGPGVTYVGRFEVVNDSGEDVKVMPVAALGGGQVGPLPLLRRGRMPGERLQPVAIAAGESEEFQYDLARGALTCLLIDAEAGNMRVLLATRRYVTRPDSPSEPGVHYIPPMEALPTAPSSLIPCMYGEKVRLPSEASD